MQLWERIPTPLVALGALALVWWAAAGPGTHHAGEQAPAAAEDIQAGPDPGRPGWDPFQPAHAPGYPYELGYVCPDVQPGRTKGYPRGVGGALGMLACPDPQDSDSFPWISYGGPRG
jgi:hypothetical protein